MRKAKGRGFFLQTAYASMCDALAKAMPLAGALAMGGAGPVLGDCHPDQAGLGALARTAEEAGLAIIVDCASDPALAQVMAQDSDALPRWVQAQAAKAEVTVAAKTTETEEPKSEPTLPPQVVWNGWWVDTLRREKTTATSHLYQPPKVTTIRQPGQALQVRLFVPL